MSILLLQLTIFNIALTFPLSNFQILIRQYIQFSLVC